MNPLKETVDVKRCDFKVSKYRWIFITGVSQSNQWSVYENEYVRKGAICVLVGIAQLVEHQAETDHLTFIKKDIARSNLANYFYYLVFYLFIYNYYFFFS